MFRPLVALALACGLLSQTRAAFASPAPELLARSSGGVSIERRGDENPMVEVARSTFWGALAGLAVGTAITLVDDQHSGEPIRWGVALGTFAGLGAGIYYVAHRPVPESLLELRDGKLAPSAVALGAIEPVAGGVQVRAVAVRF